MDTPVQANTIGTYIGSPNHTTNYNQVRRWIRKEDTLSNRNTVSRFSRDPQIKFTALFVHQNDVINVGGELGSNDAGYFSTSPQMAYQPATTTSTATQQLTPQTPNTPTIILTGKQRALRARQRDNASPKKRDEMSRWFRRHLAAAVNDASLTRTIRVLQISPVRMILRIQSS